MTIYPTPGIDTVSATATDGWLIGAPNHHYIGYTGNFDNNNVSYQLASAPVIASLGNPSINTGDATGDTYTNIQGLVGSPFGGSLYGDSSGQTEQLWALGGTNFLYGGSGYTTFISGPGDDHIVAGVGGGLADYEVAHAAVTVSLANPQQNTGEAAGDTYSGIHNIAGSGYNDVLFADNNGDNILGGGGNNIIHGGTGADTINGGPGANTEWGGAGSDWFVFGGSATDTADAPIPPLTVLTNAQQGIFTTVMDFDQGNSGHYDSAEFDSIDVAPLMSLQFHGNLSSVASDFRAIEDSSNTSANFQISLDGSGSNWITLANLAGVPAGGSVHLVLDESQPFPGVVLTVQPAAASPTSGQVGVWEIVNGQLAGSVDLGSHGSDSAVVGDFNGDGTSDVVWSNATTGHIDEWQMVNGSWAGGVDLGSHPGSGWQTAAAGDFNGDGTSDLLFFNSGTGQTDIWELSNGNWAASTNAGAHSTAYQVAGIGDFDHNGTSDILWYNPTTGNTDVWQIANGQWAGSTTLGSHPGTGWQVSGVGDFNHDGTSDVLWFNPGTGQTDLWELANGKWAASVNPGSHSGIGWQVAGVGDFNHDGTSDILWLNSASGQTDIWEFANGQWAGSVNPGTHQANFQVAGIGDFNHDGTSDILWHGL